MRSQPAADGQIRVYDPESGRLVRHIHAHKDAVLALAIAPNGHQVLSAGVDPVVRLWEIVSGHSTGAGLFRRCTRPSSALPSRRKATTFVPATLMASRLWNVVGPTSARRFPLTSETPVVALAVKPEQ